MKTATVEDFLAKVALFTQLDDDRQTDTVKLMTIHSSKGMEFPYVFLCGLNECFFPGRRIQTVLEMEEERRLAYVAMTRAQQGLHLSDAEGTANDGLFKYPSRFIFDSSEAWVDFDVPLDESLHARARRYIEEDERLLIDTDALLTPGDRVTHPVFGAGTLLAVQRQSGSYSVQFDALATDRTLQFGAPLTKMR